MVCFLGEESDLLKLAILIDLKVFLIQARNQCSFGCRHRDQDSNKIDADDELVIVVLVRLGLPR